MLFDLFLALKFLNRICHAIAIDGRFHEKKLVSMANEKQIYFSFISPIIGLPINSEDLKRSGTIKQISIRFADVYPFRNSKFRLFYILTMSTSNIYFMCVCFAMHNFYSIYK